jgi:hypothetical protein
MLQNCKMQNVSVAKILLNLAHKENTFLNSVTPRQNKSKLIYIVL